VYRRSQKAGALGGVLGRVVSEVVVAVAVVCWSASAVLAVDAGCGEQAQDIRLRDGPEDTTGVAHPCSGH
jgi:hypothetical protein